jgi:hypothetical protein
MARRAIFYDDPCIAARRFPIIMMFVATPVTVHACGYSTLPPSFDLDGLKVPHASLRIVFRDIASMPARTMRFDVQTGRARQTTDDIGTLSPLVMISHDVSAAPDASLDGPQQCSVDAVTFAGESHWTRH